MPRRTGSATSAASASRQPPARPCFARAHSRRVRNGPSEHNGEVATRQPVDDLYAELGVGTAATPDEISAAFRARARELHPDANSGDPVAEEQFKRLSAAYGVLSDPARRARYDDQVVVRSRAAVRPNPAAQAQEPTASET